MIMVHQMSKISLSRLDDDVLQNILGLVPSVFDLLNLEATNCGFAELVNYGLKFAKQIDLVQPRTVMAKTKLLQILAKFGGQLSWIVANNEELHDDWIILELSPKFPKLFPPTLIELIKSDPYSSKQIIDLTAILSIRNSKTIASIGRQSKIEVKSTKLHECLLQLNMLSRDSIAANVKQDLSFVRRIKLIADDNYETLIETLNLITNWFSMVSDIRICFCSLKSTAISVYSANQLNNFIRSVHNLDVTIEIERDIVCRSEQVMNILKHHVTSVCIESNYAEITDYYATELTNFKRLRRIAAQFYSEPNLKFLITLGDNLEEFRIYLHSSQNISDIINYLIGCKNTCNLKAVEVRFIHRPEPQDTDELISAITNYCPKLKNLSICNFNYGYTEKLRQLIKIRGSHLDKLEITSNFSFDIRLLNDIFLYCKNLKAFELSEVDVNLKCDLIQLRQQFFELTKLNGANIIARRAKYDTNRDAKIIYGNYRMKCLNFHLFE
ncbi:hypothetical protein HDE_12747 [Halotydeus destructor]|nr:hypothetical protein HDE_12747 [Halotydeus destructor]